MNSKSHTLYSLQKRILVLTVLISFIFIALFVRLFFVQVINSKYLQNLAEDQWTRALPIASERGKIYDTNGVSLAVSYSSYNIYSRAREVENAEETANFLCKFLDLPKQKVFDKLTDSSVSEVLISTKITSEQAIEIIKKQYKGIYVTEDSTRYYPYGNLLTQVLGFVTSDNQGQAGIELYYDDKLKGTNGYSLIQSDLTGVSLDNSLDTFTSAIPGDNITLTIDVNLQKIVEQTLEKIMTEQKAKSVSCIITKTKTGEILAMSQKPSFDLNNVPRDDVSYLMESVKNKSVVDIYEPGSTFKIITMAMALESEKAHLSDTFYCPGYCIVDGEKIKCWKSIGHGSQTLAEGLANSCNCVFTNLAQRLGLDKFYEYLSLFGYGTQTGIEISGESGGLLMNKSSVKVVDLARMGFGQAVAVTLLQQIMAISCAVNGGYLYSPYIVKNIKDSNHNVILENNTKIVRKVISEETSKILCDMLDLTVSKQTGKYSFVPGYSVGGKTGTTQKYADGKIAGTYISSFAGVYPLEDPEYTLIISVDEPGAGAYYGSIVASPYAKEIFSKLFELYDIEPDSPDLANNKPTELEMPNLVGMSLTQAIKTLSENEISYEINGNGSKVISQFPSPTVKIYSTDTVVIDV